MIKLHIILNIPRSDGHRLRLDTDFQEDEPLCGNCYFHLNVYPQLINLLVPSTYYDPSGDDWRK